VEDWEWHHIHATLAITINGRELPSLGFFGPDDVCLDNWVPVLTEVVAALSASPEGEYTFDEGEQGQPAFRWVRDGAVARVSIVASASSGGQADPEWQHVPFAFHELREQVARFLDDLRSEIERQAPTMAAAWWQRAASTTP
jgi:hypothetical protein